MIWAWLEIALPYYRFDPDAGMLHFKAKDNEEWRVYDLSIAESDRAKRHFNALVQ